MNMDPEFIGEVEMLRKAAKENEVVFDLLALINRSLLIDEAGNREIIADDEDTRLLVICDVAASFALYDHDSDLSANDLEKFKESIARIYGLYEKEINPFVIDIWWNALKSYDLAVINQAFDKHVVDPDNGKWLPKPSDIIRMLESSGA